MDMASNSGLPINSVEHLRVTLQCFVLDPGGKMNDAYVEHRCFGCCRELATMVFAGFNQLAIATITLGLGSFVTTRQRA